ncbi:hypothetical protein ACFV98_02815 [Streptomyces violascens]|uniref:hypothetical protein n=1 Tax=Streptomyces violascens TaxID=67381 RepID=UPI003662A631
MTAEDTLPPLPLPEASDALCTAVPEADVDLALRCTQFMRTAEVMDSPAPGVYVEAVIPVHWEVDGGIVAVHSDGTVATQLIGDHPPLHILETGTRHLLARSFDYLHVPSPGPSAETIAQGFMEMGRPVPEVLQALNARQAAMTGDTAQVERFTSEVLGWWSGWQEPVSTALLGRWTAPLHREGHLSLDALSCLRSEAQAIHRQLKPVWRRKINGSRLLLLDTPLGDGLTLYDLVAPEQRPAFEVEPNEPRLAALLRALTPAERVVVWSWTHPGVATWSDAALLAGAAYPDTAGEKVRRRVRYLVAEQERRRAMPGAGEPDPMAARA